MIARMWHGRTKAADADKYLEYLNQSGIPLIAAYALLHDGIVFEEEKFAAR